MLTSTKALQNTTNTPAATATPFFSRAGRVMPAGTAIQRKCSECEKEEKEQVQRKESTTATAGGKAAPPVVSSVLSSAGQPMDTGARQFMENRFGQDFGQVRIHVGDQAAASATAIQARAYTSGKDIVFGAGEYQPGSESGRRLLAHELAHVGQQKNLDSLIARQPADAGVDSPHAAPIDAGVLPPAGVPAGVDPFATRRNALMGQIKDDSWIAATVFQFDLDAHPKHWMDMFFEIIGLTESVKREMAGFENEIQAAATPEEFLWLEIKLAGTVIAQKLLLQMNILATIERYRNIERGWLNDFLTHPPFEKDPATFNDSAKNRLEFHPGAPGLAKVITRIKYNWRSTLGIALGAAIRGVPAWAQHEIDNYKMQFQFQLNNVWNTQNNVNAPFSLTEPQDYLLKNDPIRWSNLKAHMFGEVLDAGEGPFHYEVDVWKTTDPGERSWVLASGGKAEFHQPDATAGIDPAGVPTSGQQTLAHEWAHMIGLPDEYAESSKSDEDDWNACKAHLFLKGWLGASALEEQQSKDDLKRLEDFYGISNLAVNNSKGKNIYDLTDPDALPDECFAARSGGRLRPGDPSDPGGTNIAESVTDEQRITVMGNEVRPYHREGVLAELNTMLSGETDPLVKYDQNFATMTHNDIMDVMKVRIRQWFR